MSQGDNFEEIRTWRLIASVIWHWFWIVPAYLAWAVLTGASLGSLRVWACLPILLALQLPPLLAHLVAMFPRPPSPTPTLLATVVANGTTELRSGLVVVGAHGAAAALAMPLLVVTRQPGTAWSWMWPLVSSSSSLSSAAMSLGLVVGCMVGLRLSLGGECTPLHWTHAHRPRLFRLKHRLALVLRSGVSAGVGAWALHLALVMGGQLHPLLLPSCSSSTLGHTATTTTTTGGWWWALVTSALLAASQIAAFHIAEVIHTERHSFFSLAPQATPEQHCNALIKALKTSAVPLIQHLAYQDLAELSLATSAQLTWRRQAVFQLAGGGQVWVQLATLASQPLRDLLAALQPVVGPLRSAPRGSVLDRDSRAPPPVLPHNAVAHATWTIRHSFQKVRWSVMCLGGLAAAARSEDEFGALQLKEPGLGNITALLLDALTAARLVVAAGVDPGLPRSSGLLWISSSLLLPLSVPRQARGAGHHAVTAALPNLLSPLHRPASLLVDMLENSLYGIVGTYGSELLRGIEGQKSEFGDSKIRTSLLKAMIDYSG